MHVEERGPTILLIEDDDDVRPGLTEMLRKEGYRVTVALDAEDALGRIRNGVLADLALLDLGKPADDVLRAGQRLRSEADFPINVPVVVIASDFDEDSEGKNIPAGIWNWIVYWDEPKQLTDLLKGIFSKGAATQGH